MRFYEYDTLYLFLTESTIFRGSVPYAFISSTYTSGR